MKSPFPGMNPYLEARWSDVRSTLLVYIGEALQAALPVDLRARSEEQFLFEESDSDTDEDPLQMFRADVAVIDTRRNRAMHRQANAAIPAPLYIQFDDGPPIDRWVKIIDITNGNRVITIIEVLSPWNKSTGRLNDLYLKKLNDYMRGGVSIVEIDLLRGHRQRLFISGENFPKERRTAYLTCVKRAWVATKWEAYPIPLREPLPPIPIPLRKTDRDAILALQPLIDRIYVAGGHDDINYSKPPDPPLTSDDEAWAEALLREAGLRK